MFYLVQRWVNVSHTFQNYPAGVRYIRFESSGKDMQHWNGNYGVKMAQASVVICDGNSVKLSLYNNFIDSIRIDTNNDRLYLTLPSVHQKELFSKVYDDSKPVGCVKFQNNFSSQFKHFGSIVNWLDTKGFSTSLAE
jgi:hypothetical protein